MSVDLKSIKEAVAEAKEKSKKRKFKQSIELLLSLKDLDLQRPENRINELIELPNLQDKLVKVCVIASGDLALKAKRAGAEKVIEKAELDALLKDKKTAKALANEYNVFIAEAPLMPQVGRALGFALGPRGRMPTPVPPTAQIETVIGRQRKSIRVNVRSLLNVQCTIGTEDMPDDKVAENIQAVLNRLREKLTKGTRNIRSVYVKTTMGPPVKMKQ
jgi:large subunit ribosomal protein L1